MLVSRRGLLSGVPLLLAGRARAEAAPVQVYAAMTFRPALERVLATWRDAGGDAVAVYGPTPVLIRQLAGGAPADILLTADTDWMDAAVQQGLVQANTRSNLLANDLVLAGAPGSAPIGVISKTFRLQALLNGGRLALCDPDHDPAGKFAKQSLQALGLWDSVAPHIAIAESAPAAVVLVDHGEAAAAVCFRTDLHSDDHAVLVGIFPADSHAPIVYPVALASAPRNPHAAGALAFLRGPDALRIFTGFGYRPPP